TERAARLGQIRLSEILVMGVGIIEVIGLKIGLQSAIQNKDELIKRSSLTAAEFENARALAGAHLLRQMINHACGHAFVRFAWAINIEVTQAYNDPIRILAR